MIVLVGTDRVQGVPKAWEEVASTSGKKLSTVTSETEETAPASLIPTTAVASAGKEKKPKKKKAKKLKPSDFELSGPSNFRQTVHVDFNSETGFIGLPDEWDALLKSSAISKQEVIDNQDAIISALEFYDNGYKATAKKKEEPATDAPQLRDGAQSRKLNISEISDSGKEPCVTPTKRRSSFIPSFRLDRPRRPA